MFKHVSFFLSVFTLAALSACERPHTVRAECQKPASSPADPWQVSRGAQIKNLYDLPRYVCEKLLTHLDVRLGEDIARRLVFDGGRKSDAFEEPAKAESNLLFNLEHGYATVKPFTYSLRFAIKEIAPGVSYDGHIGLSSGGRVVSEFEFPPLTERPDRATVLAPQCAQSWADAAGFPRDDFIRLSYDQDSQRLFYGFQDEGRRMPQWCLIRFRSLAVDAHTCRVLWIQDGMVSPYAC